VTQNALVVVDVLLLLGFVVAGLFYGSWSWPSWTPPNASEGFATQPFVQSLFFIAFAFAGWNASAYVAGEFRDPERDAPRAMLLGTGGVAILYLIVNWVFVANLSPDQSRAVFEYEQSRVTLGHLVMSELIGPAAGAAMSILVICAFTASTSAMTMAGPRIYAEMAKDGFLPRALIGKEGRPPVVSVLVQSSQALAILYTHTLREALARVGAILTLFTALVCASLFKVWWRPGSLKPPDGLTLVAAAVHVAMAVYMLWFGLSGQTGLLGWVAGVAAIALVAYFLSPHRAARSGAGDSAG
jgi:APA family basic amino acid/polyamine antiporter